MKWLHLEDDGSVEREVRLARIETLRAAVSATAALPPDKVSDVLRRRYALMLARAEAGLSGDAVAATSLTDERRALDRDAAMVRAATSSERKRLLELRADGTIGNAAFQRVEQELDWEELFLQQVTGGTLHDPQEP